MAAVTFEPNFNLALPPFDHPRYHDLVNNNTVSIGALLAKYVAVLNVRGVWANATLYGVDDVAVDATEGQLYRALASHTSSSAPQTFAQYRAANPSIWTSASVGFRARGTWLTGTSYALGDFVEYENIFAVCLEAHTSGATFAVDSAKWSYLIDLRSVTELRSIVDKTDDYTFAIDDVSRMIRLTGASNKTFTVPPESSVAFATRDQMFVCQAGTGVLTIAADVGVTVNSEFSRYKLNTQHSAASLLKTGSNEWLLTGSLRP